ncbi:MAG: glycosyltransferase family 2 protein [Lachnospiraceae bacterium]|nr:glycosyltransferase family 2 protein [Candidatus Colinaster equi]
MKTITIVVPTYNEEANIASIYERVCKLFNEQLAGYEMQLLFADNASKDNTRQLIRELAKKDTRVQAIFNATNFGFSKSSFYGLSQAEGDAAVLMYADMQDPPEVIPQMVKKWEEGYKIVVGIKSKSRENKLMYAIRGIYYKLISKISETEHIEQYDGFGLYDQDFIKELRALNDPLPYLRGLVAEMGYERAEVEYEQEVRKKGKSSFNLMGYYDVAMLGLTSSSRAVMRMATFLGLGLSAICVVIALVTLILKIVNWEYFDVGTAAIIIGIFFVGGIQIFFLGFLGEYIANINVRTMNHPVVVEDMRINMTRDVSKKE